VVGDVMSLPGFPIGPVNETRLNRAAEAMLEFGELSKQDSKNITSGALINSMIDPALQSVISNNSTTTTTSSQ
jgi:hypothetical protein